MAQVRDVLDAIASIAPPEYAFEMDHIGLQVGRQEAVVSKAVVTFDISLGAIEHARREGAELIIAHHPLIWNPLQGLTDKDYTERRALELANAGINFIASHTNWDCAPDGLNDFLATRLGMQETTSFGSSSENRHLKLVTYVPVGSLQTVIDAVSSAGAGKIGSYERCAFFVAGIGTYLPNEGANPKIGKIGEIEEVQEAMLEMVFPERLSTRVISALVTVHPYETPAYHTVSIQGTPRQPAGRLGTIPPTTLREFVTWIDKQLETRCLAWGDPDRIVTKIGVVGGAADGDWQAALAVGADVFVTGEVRQHNALEAGESGLSMIQAGHFATEAWSCRRLIERLGSALPELEFLEFVPEAGRSGRPFTSDY
ncbi:MAG: Nif3-like dinuclear metal center hexameric protein [Armatimonadetes bacterium]|nr:Nif3-like dinuclear metal center hexameric protein [Armatimonadota bacterium]